MTRVTSNQLAKQAVLEWLREQEQPITQMVQALVAVPSDNPAGDCRAIAAETVSQLAKLELSPRLLPVPEEIARQAGMIAADNVVAELLLGSGEGPVIILNAHGDVVPPGEGWTMDPYGGVLREGKLYGRGAAVSKSDIAVYTYAAVALREAAPGLNGKIVLAFTYDEETGGEIGPQRLLQSGQLRGDYAICAGFTHAAVNAHNGCLHVEVTLIGKSAHAAIPHTGQDAVQAMTELLMGLYRYRDELSANVSRVKGIEHPTLTIGLIHGGINTNVVPDLCTIRIDRRIIPEENPEQAEQALLERIAQLTAGMAGIRVEVKRIMLARPFGPVPEDHPLLLKLSRNWSEQMGGVLPVEGVPLYADARHFAEAGIPTVMFGAGPRTLEEANGHRADEHVNVDDLQAAARIVALTLYDLLDEGVDSL
ncbi:ArgE/DapE family deacylase [Paenibacillus sp. GCM10023252]|uniref:ArgE/DapE family deacylase n=1 Tax=Paenibacillus sp. GCM10023252 TaxID=3252649 RepID=UPI00360E4B36